MNDSLKQQKDFNTDVGNTYINTLVKNQNFTGGGFLEDTVESLLGPNAMKEIKNQYDEKDKQFRDFVNTPTEIKSTGELLKIGFDVDAKGANLFEKISGQEEYIRNDSKILKLFEKMLPKYGIFSINLLMLKIAEWSGNITNPEHLDFNNEFNEKNIWMIIPKESSKFIPFNFIKFIFGGVDMFTLSELIKKSDKDIQTTDVTTSIMGKNISNKIYDMVNEKASAYITSRIEVVKQKHLMAWEKVLQKIKTDPYTEMIGRDGNFTTKDDIFDFDEERVLSILSNSNFQSFSETKQFNFQLASNDLLKKIRQDSYFSENSNKSMNTYTYFLILVYVIIEHATKRNEEQNFNFIGYDSLLLEQIVRDYMPGYGEKKLSKLITNNPNDFLTKFKSDFNVYSDTYGENLLYFLNILSAVKEVETREKCDFYISPKSLETLSFSDLWTKKIQPYLSNCLEPIIDKRNAATSISYIEALKKSFACANANDEELEDKCKNILDKYEEAESLVENLNLVGDGKLNQDKTRDNTRLKLKLVKFLQKKLMDDFCGTSFNELQENQKFALEGEEYPIDSGNLDGKTFDFNKFRPFLLIINGAYQETEITVDDKKEKSQLKKSFVYLMPEDIGVTVKSIVETFKKRFNSNFPGMLMYWISLYKSLIAKAIYSFFTSTIVTNFIGEIENILQSIVNNTVAIVDQKVTIDRSKIPLTQDAFLNYLSYKLYKKNVHIDAVTDFLLYKSGNSIERSLTYNFCSEFKKDPTKNCLEPYPIEHDKSQPRKDEETDQNYESRRLLMRKQDLFRHLLEQKVMIFTKNVDNNIDPIYTNNIGDEFEIASIVEYDEDIINNLGNNIVDYVEENLGISDDNNEIFYSNRDNKNKKRYLIIPYDKYFVEQMTGLYTFYSFFESNILSKGLMTGDKIEKLAKYTGLFDSGSLFGYFLDKYQRGGKELYQSLVTDFIFSKYIIGTDNMLKKTTINIPYLNWSTVPGRTLNEAFILNLIKIGIFGEKTQDVKDFLNETYLPDSNDNADHFRLTIKGLNFKDINPLKKVLRYKNIGNEIKTISSDGNVVMRQQYFNKDGNLFNGNKLISFEEYNSVMSKVISIISKSSTNIPVFMESLLKLRDDVTSPSDLLNPTIIGKLLLLPDLDANLSESEIIVKSAILEQFVTSIKGENLVDGNLVDAFITFVNFSDVGSKLKDKLIDSATERLRKKAKPVRDAIVTVKQFIDDVGNITGTQQGGNIVNPLAGLSPLDTDILYTFKDMTNSSREPAKYLEALSYVKNTTLNSDELIKNIEETLDIDLKKISNSSLAKLYSYQAQLRDLNEEYHIFDYSNNLYKIISEFSDKNESKISLLQGKFWLYLSNKCAGKGIDVKGYDKNNRDLDICLKDAVLELGTDFIEKMVTDIQKGDVGASLLKFDAGELKDTIDIQIRDVIYQLNTISDSNIELFDKSLQFFDANLLVKHVVPEFNKLHIHSIVSESKIKFPPGRENSTMEKNWEKFTDLTDAILSDMNALYNNNDFYESLEDLSDDKKLMINIYLRVFYVIYWLNRKAIDKYVSKEGVDYGTTTLRYLIDQSFKKLIATSLYTPDEYYNTDTILGYLDDSIFRIRRHGRRYYDIERIRETIKKIESFTVKLNNDYRVIRTVFSSYTRDPVVRKMVNIDNIGSFRNIKYFVESFKNTTYSIQQLNLRFFKELSLKANDDVILKYLKTKTIDDFISKEQPFIGKIYLPSFNSKVYEGIKSEIISIININKAQLKYQKEFNILAGVDKYIGRFSLKYNRINKKYNVVPTKFLDVVSDLVHKIPSSLKPDSSLSFLTDNSTSQSGSDDGFLVNNRSLRKMQKFIYKTYDLLQNFNPNLATNKRLVRIIVQIIFTVLGKIGDAQGFELLINQQVHGFVYTLLKPQAKLHKVLKKALSSYDPILLAQALTKIFAANLPTLLHKLIQMVEPKIKAAGPEAKKLFEDWWGKKLTYPMMGNIELDNIFDDISIPKYSFEKNGKKYSSKAEYEKHKDYEIGYYLNFLNETAMNNGIENTDNRIRITKNIWNSLDELKTNEFNPKLAIIKIFGLDGYDLNTKLDNRDYYPNEFQKYKKVWNEYDVYFRGDSHTLADWTKTVRQIISENSCNQQWKQLKDKYFGDPIKDEKLKIKLYKLKNGTTMCFGPELLDFFIFLSTEIKDMDSPKGCDGKDKTKDLIKLIKTLLRSMSIKTGVLDKTVFELKLAGTTKNETIIKSLLGDNYVIETKIDKLDIKDENLYLVRGDIMHKKLNEPNPNTRPFPLAASVGQVHVYYSNEKELNKQLVSEKEDKEDKKDSNILEKIDYMSDRYLDYIEKYTLLKSDNEVYMDKLIQQQKKLRDMKSLQITKYFKTIERLSNELNEKLLFDDYSSIQFTMQQLNTSERTPGSSSLNDLIGATITYHTQKIIYNYYKEFVSFRTNDWFELKVDTLHIDNLRNINSSVLPNETIKQIMNSSFAKYGQNFYGFDETEEVTEQTTTIANYIQSIDSINTIYTERIDEYKQQFIEDIKKDINKYKNMLEGHNIVNNFNECKNRLLLDSKQINTEEKGLYLNPVSLKRFKKIDLHDEEYRRYIGSEDDYKFLDNGDTHFNITLLAFDIFRAYVFENIFKIYDGTRQSLKYKDINPSSIFGPDFKTDEINMTIVKENTDNGNALRSFLVALNSEQIKELNKILVDKLIKDPDCKADISSQLNLIYYYFKYNRIQRERDDPKKTDCKNSSIQETLKLIIRKCIPLFNDYYVNFQLNAYNLYFAENIINNKIEKLYNILNDQYLYHKSIYNDQGERLNCDDQDERLNCKAISIKYRSVGRGLNQRNYLDFNIEQTKYEKILDMSNEMVNQSYKVISYAGIDSSMSNRLKKYNNQFLRHEHDYINTVKTYGFKHKRQANFQMRNSAGKLNLGLMIPIYIAKICIHKVLNIKRYITYQNLFNITNLRETKSFVYPMTTQGDKYILKASDNFIGLTDLYSNWKSEFIYSEQDENCEKPKNKKPQEFILGDNLSEYSYFPVLNFSEYSEDNKKDFLTPQDNNVNCLDIFNHYNEYNKLFTNCVKFNRADDKRTMEKTLSDVPFLSQEGGDTYNASQWAMDEITGLGGLDLRNVSNLILSNKEFFDKTAGYDNIPEQNISQLNLYEISEEFFDKEGEYDIRILDIQGLLSSISIMGRHYTLSNVLDSLSMSNQNFELKMSTLIEETDIKSEYKNTKKFINDEFMKNYRYNIKQISINNTKMKALRDAINNYFYKDENKTKRQILLNTNYEIFNQNFENNFKLYSEYQDKKIDLSLIEKLEFFTKRYEEMWNKVPDDIETKFSISDTPQNGNNYDTLAKLKTKLIDILGEERRGEIDNADAKKIKRIAIETEQVRISKIHIKKIKNMDTKIKEMVEKLVDYIDTQKDSIINLASSDNNILRAAIYFASKTNISIKNELTDTFISRHMTSLYNTTNIGNIYEGSNKPPNESQGEPLAKKLTIFKNIREMDNISNFQDKRENSNLSIDDMKFNVAAYMLIGIFTDKKLKVHKYLDIIGNVNKTLVPKAPETPVNWKNIALYSINSEYSCKIADQYNIFKVREFKDPLADPKDVIKFIKIRSRMMMCIEQTVFPESINEVIKTLELQDDPQFETVLNTLKFAELQLRCKITDVLGEFDLWEEIKYTMEAKELYDFPPESFKNDQNFEIKVAEVTKTFDEIRPLYTVPSKMEEINYTDKHGSKRKIKKGLYTAVIQDKMQGMDVKDYIDDGYFKIIDDNNREEFLCLQKAMAQFLGIYIKTIISPGKYHGDPHAGNIKWHYDKKKKFGYLSPIDFGDWVTITSDKISLVASIGIFISLIIWLQDEIIGISGKTFNPSYIADLFLVGLDMDKYSNQQLINIIKRNVMIEKSYIKAAEILLKECSMNQKDEVSIKKINKLRNQLIDVARNTMKSRIIRRFSDYLPSFEQKAVLELVQKPEFLTEIVSELIDKDEEGENWECETLGKEITTLIQSLSKVYDSCGWCFGPGTMIDVVFSILVQFSPDDNTKRLIAISLEYIKIIISSKVVSSKSGLTLSTAFSLISDLVSKGSVTLPNIICNGITIQKDGTHINKFGSNLIFDTIKKYSMGAITGAGLLLIIKPYVTDYLFSPTILYTGINLGLESLENSHLTNVTYDTYHSYNGGSNRLDDIKKAIDNSYNFSIGTEFVGVIMEAFTNMVTIQDLTKNERFDILSTTRNKLLNTESQFSTIVSRLGYASKMDDVFSDILSTCGVINTKFELFAEKISELSNSTADVFKKLYGSITKDILTDDYYVTNNGEVFSIKPTFYKINELPVSVTNTFGKYDLKIASIKQLYDNFDITFDDDNDIKSVELKDHTVHLNHYNSNRIASYIINNYNLYNNVKYVTDLYDYLSHSSLNKEAHLKQSLFNDYIHELFVCVKLNNMVKLNDFWINIKKGEYKTYIDIEDIDKFGELKDIYDKYSFKDAKHKNDAFKKMKEIKFKVKKFHKTNCYASKIVTNINSLREKIIDEERYLERDATSEDDKKYYIGYKFHNLTDEKGYKVHDSKYFEKLGIVKQYLINPNSIKFWNMNKLNDLNQLAVPDEILNVSPEATLTIENKEYIKYLKEWIHSRFKIKNIKQPVSNDPRNLNNIIGYIFNRVEMKEAKNGHNLFYNEEGSSFETKLESIKLNDEHLHLVVFYTLLYNCLAPMWLIDNIVPGIMMAVENKISYVSSVEKEIMDKLSLEYMLRVGLTIPKNSVVTKEIKENKKKTISSEMRDSFYSQMKYFYDDLKLGMPIEMQMITSDKLYTKHSNMKNTDIRLDGLVFDYLLSMQQEHKKQIIENFNNNTGESAEQKYGNMNLDKKIILLGNEANKHILPYTKTRETIEFGDDTFKAQLESFKGTRHTDLAKKIWKKIREFNKTKELWIIGNKDGGAGYEINQFKYIIKEDILQINNKIINAFKTSDCLTKSNYEEYEKIKESISNISISRQLGAEKRVDISARGSILNKSSWSYPSISDDSEIITEHEYLIDPGAQNSRKYLLEIDNINVNKSEKRKPIKESDVFQDYMLFDNEGFEEIYYLNAYIVPKTQMDRKLNDYLNKIGKIFIESYRYSTDAWLFSGGSYINQNIIGEFMRRHFYSSTEFDYGEIIQFPSSMQEFCKKVFIDISATEFRFKDKYKKIIEEDFINYCLKLNKISIPFTVSINKDDLRNDTSSLYTEGPTSSRYNTLRLISKAEFMLNNNDISIFKQLIMRNIWKGSYLWMNKDPDDYKKFCIPIQNTDMTLADWPPEKQQENITLFNKFMDLSTNNLFTYLEKQIDGMNNDTKIKEIFGKNIEKTALKDELEHIRGNIMTRNIKKYDIRESGFVDVIGLINSINYIMTVGHAGLKLAGTFNLLGGAGLNANLDKAAGGLADISTSLPILGTLIKTGYLRAGINIAEYFSGHNIISKNAILTNNQFNTINKHDFIEYDKEINSSFLAESRLNANDDNVDILTYFNDMYGCKLFKNEGRENRKLFEQSLLFVNPKKQLDSMAKMNVTSNVLTKTLTDGMSDVLFNIGSVAFSKYSSRTLDDIGVKSGININDKPQIIASSEYICPEQSKLFSLIKLAQTFGETRVVNVSRSIEHESLYSLDFNSWFIPQRTAVDADINIFERYIENNKINLIKRLKNKEIFGSKINENIMYNNPSLITISKKDGTDGPMTDELSKIYKNITDTENNTCKIPITDEHITNNKVVNLINLSEEEKEQLKEYVINNKSRGLHENSFLVLCNKDINNAQAKTVVVGGGAAGLLAGAGFMVFSLPTLPLIVAGSAIAGITYIGPKKIAKTAASTTVAGLIKVKDGVGYGINQAMTGSWNYISCNTPIGKAIYYTGLTKKDEERCFKYNHPLDIEPSVEFKVTNNTDTIETKHNYLFNLADDIVLINDYETILRYDLYKNSRYLPDKLGDAIKNIPIYDSVIAQMNRYLEDDKGFCIDIVNIVSYLEPGKSIRLNTKRNLLSRYEYIELEQIKSLLMNVYFLNKGVKISLYEFAKRSMFVRYGVVSGKDALVSKLRHSYNYYKLSETKPDNLMNNQFKENNINMLSKLMSILMKPVLKLYTTDISKMSTYGKFLTKKIKDKSLIQDMIDLESKLVNIQQHCPNKSEDKSNDDTKKCKLLFTEEDSVNNSQLTEYFFREHIKKDKYTYNDL